MYHLHIPNSRKPSQDGVSYPLYASTAPQATSILTLFSTLLLTALRAYGVTTAVLKCPWHSPSKYHAGLHCLVSQVSWGIWLGLADEL
jgi:hypothetical protein